MPYSIISECYFQIKSQNIHVQGPERKVSCETIFEMVLYWVVSSQPGFDPGPHMIPRKKTKLLGVIPERKANSKPENSQMWPKKVRNT